MAPVSAPTVTNVASGVTVDGVDRSPQPLAAGSASPMLETSLKVASLHFSFDKELEDTVDGVPVKADVKGSAELTPEVDLSLGMQLWTVKNYSLAAGFDVSESVSAEASVQADKTWTLPLASVSDTFGGTIGVVPVWATVTGTLVLTVSLSGKVEESISWDTKGVLMAGLQGDKADGLKPHPFVEVPTGSVTGTASAVGNAQADLSGDVELDLYSLAGPSLEVGYGVGGQAKAAVDTTQPVSGAGSASGAVCLTFTYGPIVKLGLSESEGLKKLTGVSFTLPSVDKSPAPGKKGGCKKASTQPVGGSGSSGGKSGGSHTYGVGTTFTVGSWAFDFGAADKDAWTELHAANSYNEPAKSGWRFVTAPVTFTFKGSGSQSPSEKTTVRFYGGDKKMYSNLDSGGYCGVTPDPLSGVGALSSGTSAQAEVCAVVPASAIAGGHWAVTADSVSTPVYVDLD